MPYEYSISYSLYPVGMNFVLPADPGRLAIMYGSHNPGAAELHFGDPPGSAGSFRTSFRHTDWITYCDIGDLIKSSVYLSQTAFLGLDESFLVVSDDECEKYPFPIDDNCPMSARSVRYTNPFNAPAVNVLPANQDRVALIFGAEMANLSFWNTVPMSNSITDNGMHIEFEDTKVIHFCDFGQVVRDSVWLKSFGGGQGTVNEVFLVR